MGKSHGEETKGVIFETNRSLSTPVETCLPSVPHWCHTLTHLALELRAYN